MTAHPGLLLVPPSHAQVLQAVSAIEPCTVMDVARRLDVPWSMRTTIRNRLRDLMMAGYLIVDPDRPMRFAMSEDGWDVADAVDEADGQP